MSPKLDAPAIAHRIRSLLAGYGANLDAAAHRIGTDGQALRRSVDPRAPRQSVAVLSALVRTFGVDPSWLLYGRYDGGTHQAALEKGPSLTGSDFLALAESPRFVSSDEPSELRPGSQLDA